jgi:hypothetical protein
MFLSLNYLFEHESNAQMTCVDIRLIPNVRSSVKTYRIAIYRIAIHRIAISNLAGERIKNFLCVLPQSRCGTTK